MDEAALLCAPPPPRAALVTLLGAAFVLVFPCPRNIRWRTQADQAWITVIWRGKALGCWLRFFCVRGRNKTCRSDAVRWKQTWPRVLALPGKQSSGEAALEEGDPFNWVPLLFAFGLMGSAGAVTHWTATTVV